MDFGFLTEMDNFIQYEKAKIYTMDNITRCPQCNLIPSLNFSYVEKKPIIHYECENKHQGDISIEHYISKYNNYSILKEKCKECGKCQKEAKGNFFYCTLCRKFLCNSCQIKDQEGENHNIINYKRYDSFCQAHYNSFCFYCVTCKKNLCIFCRKSHYYHDIIDLSGFSFSSESKKKLEEKVKKIESQLNCLNTLIKRIIEIKKNSEFEIIYYKILLFTYQFEQKQNNINFNLVQNLRNFEKNINPDINNIYDIIYQQGIKFISLFDKLENYESNSMTNNYKTLKNHSSTIYYLAKLNDGRLASCSDDYCLNIYKLETFELQQSIKVHSSYVRYFTQLIDGRIVTCSYDNTMKLIRLIGENKYQIDQEITGHSGYVCKVIEINQDKLISVSYDRLMKIWNLDESSNKFTLFKDITFQNNNSYCNIFKLTSNEFVTLSYSDKCIKFWNSNNYKNIKTISNIETYYTVDNLCLVDYDILCVGGYNSKGFYLIKISTHELLKTITGPQYIYSIHECIDGLFLCSIYDENGYHSIAKYKYDTSYLNLVKVKSKDQAHGGNNIYSSIELNNGDIASAGSDSSIKLWKN